ncbi:MAG: bifunctional oligoribonuclease/PAP phosphatase NrnA, partial [Muribaculaceae bacterium]|nr:bifunctional oligoribonuclease/PAP phosphatase NrnA [Muribaculaceae bacterium]
PAQLEVSPSQRAARRPLDTAHRERFHYEQGDSEGLVNRPLEVKGMVYSIFIREDPECIKDSARCCEGFQLSEICKNLYGGGGHLQAAGGEFHGTLQECRKILIDAMPDYDRYLKNKK